MNRNTVIAELMKMHLNIPTRKHDPVEFKDGLEHMTYADLAWYADYCSDGMIKLEGF
jgi:hypothetical protein